MSRVARRSDDDIEREIMSMKAGDLFTEPWPGPGNSEGPVEPEPSMVPMAARPVAPGLGPEAGSVQLVSTAPWPGPGDSEGAAYR